MATLIQDYVEGKPGGADDEMGWARMERVHFVRGLVSTGYDKIKEALAVDDMDEIGDRHPSAAGLFAVSRQVKSEAQDTAEVTISYERRDPISIAGGGAEDTADYYQISLETSLVSVTTNKDHNNAVIVLEWEGGEPQCGEVTYDVPTTAVKITGRTSWERAKNAKNYVGAYNFGAFTIAGMSFDDDSWTWRCESFDGSSRDGGRTVDFTLVLLQAPLLPWGVRTWNHLQCVYIDPETGRLPAAIIGDPAKEALAIKSVRRGYLMDFSILLTGYP